VDDSDNTIYKGSFFTIKWYYASDGKSDVYDFFVKSSDNLKRKFLILVKKIGDFGKIFDKTKFRFEGDDLCAFKPKPDRYL